MLLSGIIAAWREVKPIILALSGIGLLAWLVKQKWLTVLATLVLGWIVYFFRDPEREPVSPAAEWILAPADGKVTDIELVEEPYFFKGRALRVSMFLSLFDVHVQRSPYQGRVKFLRYQSGSFAPAFLKDTADNEYNLIGMSTPHGPMAIKQITGILARRIVCWVDLDDTLETGERLGLIKFGSRVDLLLPSETEILVHVGQQTYGGQTIMGRWAD